MTTEMIVIFALATALAAALTGIVWGIGWLCEQIEVWGDEQP